MTDPPSVDAAALEELREIVGEAVDEIVECFLGDADRLLGDLRSALANRDAAGVRAAAHQLKSSSASVGAKRFSALMQRIEAAGANGALEGVDGLLAEAHDDFGAVRSYFASARFRPG